ncbi:MAG: urease accessory protein UreH [Candidatus Rokubacteria bacterium]|nr:urease accessory protein UreH [Candidatus Rokubacteria bacterium]
MSPDLLPVLTLGFLLGMGHALDADHVVAVSTMVGRAAGFRRAARLGVAWGLGHTLALAGAAVVVLGLRLAIPDRLAAAFEFLVGGLLVALGLRVFAGYRRRRVHAHPHAHDDAIHVHFHAHAAGPAHDHAHAERSAVVSLLTGMAHGLAGSAALLLLVVSRFQSVAAGLACVAFFGAGSVLGMALVSLAIALPFAVTLPRVGRLFG